MKTNSGRENAVYMVPVGIGDLSYPALNSDDMLSVLKNTKFWVVENARSFRRFLSEGKFGISIPDLSLFELNHQASQKELTAFVEQAIKQGDIGVCSEAGLPGMADPGGIVANWAHKKGIRVIPVTGPGSLVLALMASGLNGQQFTFHGYAPVKEPDLRRFLSKLQTEALKTGYTQVFIETPYRSDRFFKNLLETAPDGIWICIASNIQNANETIQCHPVATWKRQIPVLGKSPCVFLSGIPAEGLIK